MRLERGHQPTVGEQRRVDAPGQLAQIVERLGGVAPELLQQASGGGGVPLHQPVGQLQLHRQGDQLLLRAVVDVPFDPAPLLVLRRDEALLRRLEVREACLQVLGQPHVPQHQSDLGGEVGDELFLVRIA